MIELRDVSKVYKGGIAALSHVSFGIDKGEFVFIVGPSGAGKSTLIKMIYREEVPTSGSVLMNGADLGRMRRREVPFLRRNVGVVFQDFKLLPDRSVYENVAFALRVIEAGEREIRRKVPAVLEMVGLRDKANARPNESQVGERQRAALARAVVNTPPVLIADEPTGNLDPETSWGIMGLLSEINQRGAIIIMATHAKAIVDSMKKRVIHLDAGSLIRDDRRGAYAYEA